ncbi:hypothetical protein QW131_27940 [Roseibium salinum]|nr:hypothetical protein [Roseibium salinum]
MSNSLAPGGFPKKRPDLVLMSKSNSALSLFLPQEVRARSHRLLERAEAGKSAHLEVDLARLGDALALVLETARETYPDFSHPAIRHLAGS